ncbi:MAG: hypothetical protein ING19_08940 [Azospirillum sp.]|nr:hypothetical protein [Azospirillum sp.]
MTEWNPRYVQYARAHGRTPEDQSRQDAMDWPGGPNAGFVLWHKERLREASRRIPDCFAFGELLIGPVRIGGIGGKHVLAEDGKPIIGHDCYDAWLTARVDEILRQKDLSRPGMAYLLDPVDDCRLIGFETVKFVDQEGFLAVANNKSADGWTSERYVMFDRSPYLPGSRTVAAIQYKVDPQPAAGPRPMPRRIIQNIFVDEAYRRRGFATKLCDFAAKNAVLQHSDDLTPEGRAFFEAYMARKRAARTKPAGELPARGTRVRDLAGDGKTGVVVDTYLNFEDGPEGVELAIVKFDGEEESFADREAHQIAAEEPASAPRPGM